MIGEPLSKEWRLSHVQMGDRALVEFHKWASEADDGDDENAEEIAAAAALAGLLVQAAQAHYQAANVRARLS